MCPFLEEEPGCGRGRGTTSSHPCWSLAVPGVSPVGVCRSPATGSWSFALASPAPFTCQFLQKLKSSVRDVIGERGGRQELKKKKCSFHSAGKRAGSSEKIASGAGSPKGCPPPIRPWAPSTKAAEMGGSKPVRLHHAATAALKMPLNKCFEFLHLRCFCDFQSGLQIRTRTEASRK